ncbi:MAG: hypothetical protein WC414_04275 [Patescibacteria group bacterium]
MKIKKETIEKEILSISMNNLESFVLKSFLQYGLHRLTKHNNSGLAKAIRNHNYSSINKIIEKL